MFIVQPFGSHSKMRTIRKIVSSILKVRGKLPLVIDYFYYLCFVDINIENYAIGDCQQRITSNKYTFLF